MTNPEVTVIIPAYNAERWLHTTVRSVLAQTFTDWELIIVNDGSTDGTLRAAHSCGNRQVRVVDQVNAGVSSARNTGIASAKGKYLCFLDADDAMMPGNLAAKVAHLRRTNVDWVFADVAVCDENLQPTGEVLAGTGKDILRTLLLQQEPAVPLSCGNILARRTCFEQGVQFDEQLTNAADQEFTMQLASRYTGERVPGAMTLYRNQPGSMSKDLMRYQGDHLRLFRKAKAQGLLKQGAFRRRCMSNVFWAIGGSWWTMGHKRFVALPWLLRAFLLRPAVVVRPLKKRLGRT